MMSNKDMEAILGGPPIPAARSINEDVHVGYYPQRPNERLRNVFAMANLRGWPSFADLPPEAGVKEDRGFYYREVLVSTGEEDPRNAGAILHRVERRPVALTPELAMAATASGTKTDYFDGVTWLIGGQKRSVEYAENLGSGAASDGLVSIDLRTGEQIGGERKVALTASGPVEDAPNDDAPRKRAGKE